MVLLFAPFLYPVENLAQALHRIFPFARGLFEDKVANFWCSLNVIIKLRSLASISTLARLSAALTLAATLPLIAGFVYVSITRSRGAASTENAPTAAPTIKLLPHALFSSAMAFFLFSFQVHEKSILLPLMPLTLLLAGGQPNQAGQDFEWAVFLNNVGVFR